MYEHVQKRVNGIFERIVAIRRDIHMHPEVGFDVHRTAAIAAAELQKFGLAVKEGIGKTGLYADLNIPGATKRIALRADMDALPILEQNDLPYRSTRDGFSHMCGHDSHTAMLIGAAEILSGMKEHLAVNVRFIFQPNEENLPGGALSMIADGVLEGVDEIFGLHVWPALQSGMLGICEGPALGQPDVFDIEIIGNGGHAAIPQLTTDPIIIGSQFVNAAQSIVSRNLGPLDAGVVSITQFNSGSAHNVIPQSAKITGTVRTFDLSVQKKIRRRLEELLSGITAAHGADYTFKYTEGYPVTFNHSASVATILRVGKGFLSEDEINYPTEPTLGGEDFAYYTQKIPGCFMFIGSRNEEKGCIYSLHDARFQLDEDCMRTGMTMHTLLALNYEN
ncbi:MAG: M20 metallopeptidase family protein [Calditrichia bacterium]